jgi:glycosyltransferase involved in cell wall biosynthesis
MRVLMLATYFPKPLNPIMGSWALSQARAFQRAGIETEVVSFTAWVPAWAARSRGAATYAGCPPVYDWNGLKAHYPRWLVYPVGPFRRWNERHPDALLRAGWVSAAPVLDRFVREFRPDLVYAHHTGVNGFLAERLHRRHGLPYVVTDHDFGEIASCSGFSGRRRLFARVMGSAHLTVAVASRMEAEMNALFPLARTRTVQNGTDRVPEVLLRTPRPETHDGKLVIFSCGAFYPRKGFPLLIDAFAQIAGRRPEAVLRIAGDGAQRPNVEHRIREHGLEGRVHLLGFVPHEQVLQEMVWSDIFALTGWDEPFATVYSEAMSAGKPVICCSDGGITDVLENGVHGVTVPPRDPAAIAAALDLLASDPGLRRRMGESGRRLFETRLTWDHNARTMQAVFTEAVSLVPRNRRNISCKISSL